MYFPIKDPIPGRGAKRTQGNKASVREPPHEDPGEQRHGKTSNSGLVLGHRKEGSEQEEGGGGGPAGTSGPVAYDVNNIEFMRDGEKGDKSPSRRVQVGRQGDGGTNSVDSDSLGARRKRVGRRKPGIV